MIVINILPTYPTMLHFPYCNTNTILHITTLYGRMPSNNKFSLFCKKYDNKLQFLHLYLLCQIFLYGQY